MDNIEAATYFSEHYTIWEKINMLYLNGTTTEYIRCTEWEGKQDADDRVTTAHIHLKDVNIYFSMVPEKDVKYELISSTEASEYFYKHYTIWETINNLYFDGNVIEYMRCIDEKAKHDMLYKLINADAYTEDVMTHFFGEPEVIMHTNEKHITDEEEQVLLAFNKTNFSNYKQHG